MHQNYQFIKARHLIMDIDVEQMSFKNTPEVVRFTINVLFTVPKSGRRPRKPKGSKSQETLDLR